MLLLEIIPHLLYSNVSLNKTKIMLMDIILCFYVTHPIKPDKNNRIKVAAMQNCENMVSWHFMQNV